MIAMTPVVCELALSMLGPMAPGIDRWARIARSWISSERAALGGVFGGGLQTLATSLSALSLAERNRRSFARVANVLTEYLRKRLPSVREAAVQDNDLVVERFWSSIRTELAAENRARNEALGLSSTFILDEVPRSDNRQH